MRFPPLTFARFIRRVNRFRADIEVDGVTAPAHVPNSGRLSELFVSGAPLAVSPAQDPSRRTRYDIRLVKYAGVWVSIDARLPPHILAEAWSQGRLPMFRRYARLQKEVRFEDRRIDLLLEGPGGRCWIEAKSVTLVESGRALFPDAPTERGRHHVEALIRLARRDRAAIVFVIQRPDARAFTPHRQADPALAEALERAAESGVEIHAFTCEVSLEGIQLAQPIPVQLGGR